MITAQARIADRPASGSGFVAALVAGCGNRGVLNASRYLPRSTPRVPLATSLPIEAVDHCRQHSEIQPSAQVVLGSPRTSAPACTSSLLRISTSCGNGVGGGGGPLRPPSSPMSLGRRILAVQNSLAESPTLVVGSQITANSSTAFPRPATEIPKRLEVCDHVEQDTNDGIRGDLSLKLRRALSQAPLAGTLSPTSRRRCLSYSVPHSQNSATSAGTALRNGNSSSTIPVSRCGNSGGLPTSRRKHKEEDSIAEEDVASRRAAFAAAGWCLNLACSKSSRRKEPKQMISLSRSAFMGRPPVLLFRPAVGSGCNPIECTRILNDDELSAEGFGPLPKMYFCHEVTKDVHEYNVVLNCLTQSGLCRTSVESCKWALYWGAHPTTDMLRSFNPFQKANHFPASWHLGRKDLLWKNVARMRRQWPKEFSITPASYILPDDHALWTTAREQSPNALWIWKPVNSSCGKGIKIFSSNIEASVDKKLSQKNGVVQRYVHDPLLIKGLKFDLRLYVVVTSFDPLKVYINSEGLVRLATTPYAPSSNNLDNRTMHLTNYSVNKHSQVYVKNLDGQNFGVRSTRASKEAEGDAENGMWPSVGNAESEDEEEGIGGTDFESAALPTSQRKVGLRRIDYDQSTPTSSSKWSLTQLQEHFEEVGLNWNVTIDRIHDLVIKTLLCAEAPITSTWHQGANFTNLSGTQAPLPNQNCFEIYGFDVIIDKNLVPWLLEVNVFPSLSSSSPFDKRVKSQLVADTLTLVGFMAFDHELVRNAIKEEHVKRLQGLQPRIPAGAGKTHTVQTLMATSGIEGFGETEWRIILDAHDEYLRRGSLQRIYPIRETVARYAPYFAVPRYANLVLQKWLESGGGDLLSRGDHGRSRAVPPWVPAQVCFDSC